MKPKNKPENLREEMKILQRVQEKLGAEIVVLRQIIEDLRNDLSHLLPAQEDKLSPEEERIFAFLESVRFDADLKSLEENLSILKDRNARKALVHRLKIFLKNCELGIQTKNGLAAAPVWQKDRGRPNGGYMRLQYTDPDSGTSTSVESYSKIPALKLMQRPDRRKRPVQ